MIPLQQDIDAQNDRMNAVKLEKASTIEGQSKIWSHIQLI